MICLVGISKGGVGKTTTAISLTVARAKYLAAGKAKYLAVEKAKFWALERVKCLDLEEQKKGFEEHLKGLNFNDKVLLIDGDQQSSAYYWANIRQKAKIKPLIYYLKAADSGIEGIIEQNKDQYSDIIIDTGATDTEVLRYGMMMADRMLIPFQPGNFEVWDLENFYKNVLLEVQKARKLRGFKPLEIAITLSRKPATVKSKVLVGVEEYLKKVEKEKKIYLLDGGGITQRAIYSQCISQGLAASEMKPKNREANKEVSKLYTEVWND